MIYHPAAPQPGLARAHRVLVWLEFPIVFWAPHLRLDTAGVKPVRAAGRADPRGPDEVPEPRVEIPAAGRVGSVVHLIVNALLVPVAHHLLVIHRRLEHGPEGEGDGLEADGS